MEKIKIKNFSIIKKIEFDVNNINILIGEQASGKSLISKLVYFFKRIVLEDIFKSIIDSKSFNDYNNSLKLSFENIFPAYFWKNQKFKITYLYSSEKIKVEISSNDSKVTVSCSNLIKTSFTQLQNSGSLKKGYLLAENLQLAIQQLFFSSSHDVFFIPATRSFFSIVQKNVFKLNLSDVGDEYFIKKFGVIREYLKNKDIKRSEVLDKLYKNILKAEYYNDGTEEWLIKDNKKVRLRDSSTGQQELVYLLLFLTSLKLDKASSSFFIIEEPDAHVFPSTQKQLVELFATVFNETVKRISFFITTHSPYILTCFNNLLQGQNTFEELTNKKNNKSITDKKFKFTLKKLNTIISEDKRVGFDDLSVFLVKNGELADLKDYENKLIDADPIDNVSESISEEFDNLLDIKYGE